MTELRAGVALCPAGANGVLVDGADTIVERCELADASPGAEQVLAVLGALGGSARHRIGRLVLSVPVPADPFRLRTSMVPVGALRIGAPATTSVPPFAGWPNEFGAALRGPVELVAGGHAYHGQELAALDVDAVRRFGLRCRDTVGAVAVTSVDAHVNPAHELRAAALLSELLGAGVPVVSSHEAGGSGLLERENTALLDAALSPWAHRFTERLARLLAEDTIPAEVFFVGGDGTVLPAARTARHPLHLLAAPHGAARTGAAHLTGRDTLVAVEARPDRVLLSARLARLPVETGLPTQHAGVRTSMRSLHRVLVGGPPARLTSALLLDSVSRLGGGLGDAPLVVVGGSAAELTGSVARRMSPRLLSPRLLLPRDGRFAAAFGAVTGEASGGVDRLFWFGSGGLAECVALARRAAADAAIRAGADPARLRVGTVREELMTYLPVPCARLRVSATGPLLAAADSRQASD